jgi:hypothetical protein
MSGETGATKVGETLVNTCALMMVVVGNMWWRFLAVAPWIVDVV